MNMSTHEMPVLVRFNKEEFAQALGRPVTDPDVQRLGGMNVVLRPIEQETAVAAHADVAKLAGANAALKGLADTLRPVEEKLFQRLRSNPALAKRFVLDPRKTLDELGLLDAGTKTKLEGHAKTLQPLFMAKK
jgi:hypothetical protein